MFYRLVCCCNSNQTTDESVAIVLNRYIILLAKDRVLESSKRNEESLELQAMLIRSEFCTGVQLTSQTSAMRHSWVWQAASVSILSSCSCSKVPPGSVIVVVWASCYYQLIGRTRSQDRCWAAIQLSCHPGPSGHVLKREVEELDSKGQHGQQTVLMPHTYKQEKGPYSVCVSRSGNVWNQCEGSEAGPTLSLAGLIQASGWLPMIRMKARSLVVFSNYSIFHQWSAQSTTLPLLLSDELMSCCAVS